VIESLSLAALLAVFVVAAAVVWVAGVRLSDTTDVISARFGLGQALGGLILLAFATNLPEIAIVVSAAAKGDLGIAIGNILGGIAIQTAVLVFLDVFGMGASDSLMRRAASIVLVLEAMLVIAVLSVAIMASRVPSWLIFARLTPDVVLIPALWIAGIWLVGRARTGVPWHDHSGTAPDGQKLPRGHAEHKKEAAAREQGHSTARTVSIFGAAAVVTLIGGVGLEVSGDAIAERIGMSGVLFGATVLAAATALPEISTGMAAVRLGDYQLAVSDIFGGNAFLPVLFLPASLLSGQAVLAQAQSTDIYLASLGVLLTAIYICGLLFRPRKQVFRMGIDSAVVLVLYLLGTAGLVAVAVG